MSCVQVETTIFPWRSTCCTQRSWKETLTKSNVPCLLRWGSVTPLDSVSQMMRREIECRLYVWVCARFGDGEGFLTEGAWKAFYDVKTNWCPYQDESLFYVLHTRQPVTFVLLKYRMYPKFPDRQWSEKAVVRTLSAHCFTSSAM